MKNSMKWIYMVVGGVLAVAIITGAGIFYLGSEAAGPQTPAYPPSSPDRTPADWWGDDDRPMGKYEEALAAALGISVDDLEAAHNAAWEKSIDAALAEGKITEEQAEKILGRKAFGPGGRRKPVGQRSDLNSLLASELGITVAALEAAQADAHKALIDEARKNGDLTEEQFELIQSRQALAPYIQSAMAQAFEAAVDQALLEGAITQAQADLLLENGRPGMHGGNGFPAGPGMRGPGSTSPGGRFFGTGEG